MTDVRVRLRNTKRIVNTDEEGAAAIEEEGKAAEAKEQELTEGSVKSMENAMQELNEKNESLASLQSEIEELKGELSVYKQKLDELLSDEVVEKAAAEMNEEQAEAEEIIENCSLKNEKGEEMGDEEKEKFKNSLKSLHGHKLHEKVLSSVGVKVSNMSAEAVKGAFKAQRQIIANTKGTKKVAGQKMLNTLHQEPAVSQGRDARSRLGLATK